MKRTALALLAFFAAGAVQAEGSNTGVKRSFTSEWSCDNGRPVLFNAHPVRPKEEAFVTYLGNRVEVKLKAGVFTSADGKVTWQVRREPGTSEDGKKVLIDVATLKFDGLLDQPVDCRIKRRTTPAK